MAGRAHCSTKNFKAVNKETAAKIKASKAAKRQAFGAQTIEIGQDWRIIRADEFNWEIQHKGKFKGFYGKLPDALHALPASMLGEAAKNSLAEVVRGQKAIQATIEAAVQRLRITQ